MENIWLTKRMKRYIVSKDDSYKVNEGNVVVNRTIACTKSTREGRSRADSSDYIAPTLPSNFNLTRGGITMDELEDIAIRKLTPKECWRLMGFAPFKEENGKLIFDDTAFEKAKSVCSDSQLYKQAGNSIVCDVLMAILKPIVKGE